MPDRFVETGVLVVGAGAAGCFAAAAAITSVNALA